MNVYKWYKASRFCYEHKIPIIPQLIKGAIRIVWGGVIPYHALIGEGTVLGYQGLGIVIHKKAVIGKSCTISQNVTIGGGGGPQGLPVLGDYVYVGAGSVILGGVNIGDHVTIGANSVVLKDLPNSAIAVGAPAHVVRIKSNAEIANEK